MTNENRKFDFDDILLTPKTYTNIESRYNEVNPYLINNTLPLFTAPMDSVLNGENFKEFSDVGIRIVMPRTNKKEHIDVFNPIFHSYSIVDFETYFVHGTNEENIGVLPNHVLIDVANGHMSKIIKLAANAKKKNPNLIIMAGNIANPKTYRMYVESNIIDYVRIGIGNGNGCLTTQQTGVGYPNASLINECYIIKQDMIKNGYKNPTKIVADGGMKDYPDIIKALALGADYVMVGSIFNKSLESSGKNYLYGIKINPSFAKYCYNYGFPIKKQFYGMSTKIAQKKLGNGKLKTSEGVVRYRKVEYKISNWVQNFEHYLRTAMSYSDALTLEEFIGKADFNLITERAFNRFKK